MVAGIFTVGVTPGTARITSEAQRWVLLWKGMNAARGVYPRLIMPAPPVPPPPIGRS